MLAAGAPKFAILKMRRHIAVFYLLFVIVFSVMLVEVSLAALAFTATVPAPEMAEEYAEFNRKYFSEKLPKNTVVVWSRELAAMGDMGLTITDGERFTIFLDIQMKEIGYERAASETLLHEICHVDVFPYGDHGGPFQGCMESLAKRGAFRAVW